MKGRLAFAIGRAFVAEDRVTANDYLASMGFSISCISCSYFLCL